MSRVSVKRWTVCIAICTSFVVRGTAQGQRPEEKIITPERLGLPAGNFRTSEPGVRIYKAEENGVRMKIQPSGYPFTKQPGYMPKTGEVAEKHNGVDISTRPKGSVSSKPMDFKAGLKGEVVRAGGGTYNTITVKLQDGKQIQFLHSSKVYVKVGEKVTPDTVIGRSGKTGAGAVHIHIQARDKDGKILTNPDAVFRSGTSTVNTRPAGPQTRNGIGGVLINPTPRRDDSSVEKAEADDSLRDRPAATARSWPIQLPR